MDLNLKGKKALITGASRGIGRAIADSLAREGCSLALTARNGDLLGAARKALVEQFGIDVKCVAGDIARSEFRHQLHSEVGDVDILVNNAGAVGRGSLEEMTEDILRTAWDSKLFAYIEMTRAFLPGMRARRSGVILNVIGTAGQRPNARYVGSTTGNAALMMFTRSLGGDTVKDGVRVLGVNPGPTMTDKFVGGQKRLAQRVFGDESRWPELLAVMPMGRATHPEEVAEVVAFLVSDRASAISGTCVVIDGGFDSSVPPGF